MTPSVLISVPHGASAGVEDAAFFVSNNAGVSWSEKAALRKRRQEARERAKALAVSSPERIE